MMARDRGANIMGPTVFDHPGEIGWMGDRMDEWMMER